MNNHITAIFFDIGGTLRISEGIIGRDPSKIEEIISLIGEDISTDDFIARIHRGEKAYRRMVKPNYIEFSEAELWTRFLLPEYPVDFVRANAVKFNQLWRDSNPKRVLPDAVDTLRTLHKRGYRLGLISNTTSSIEGHQLLEENGLTDLFSTVLLSAAFGRRKPHPSIFIQAARETGVHPSQCAYVGDRPSRDLIGALQVGYGETIIINVAGYAIDEFDPDDYDPASDDELVMKPDHYIGQLSELLSFYPDINNVRNGSSPQKAYTLYDAALSTMWGVDQDMPFNQTFQVAREAGISRFELNHKVSAELFDEFDKDHYYVSSVHDPCPAMIPLSDLTRQDIQISSLNEENRIKAVDIVKRTIDLAVRLGSRSVVVHPGGIVGDRSRDRELRKLWEAGLKDTAEYDALKTETIADRAKKAPPHLEQVLKSLMEILAFAVDTKIAIAVENRYRYYDIPIIDEMQLLLDVSDADWYGFQYDCGHAQALGALGYSEHEEWLKRYGKRIIGTHLHDVIGITDHQVPGIGDIDFSMIASYLPQNTIRTLEIGAQATMDEIIRGAEFLAQKGCINRI